MLKLYKKYYPILETLLQTYNLEITDTHTHPLEVMNCLDLESFRPADMDLWEFPSNGKPYEAVKEGYLDGGFVTNLNHNRADTILSKFAFSFLPSEVERSIKDSYAFIGGKRILDEMNASRIRKSILLAVSPFNRIDDIFRLYGQSYRWDFLGSLDIHGIDGKSIEEEIERQKREFHICGIKMHPNLQGFYPYPEDNPDEIAGKLDILYRTAEKRGLYILLHGGRSNIVAGERQVQKFPYMLDKSGGHYGLPRNYYDKKGRSRLLEGYGCTFVLAHCVNYGINRPDVKSLIRFYHNYPHLWLETSSISAGLIAEIVRNADSERILFGSDALYNNQLNELLICIKGIEGGSEPELFEKTCCRILGENYSRLRSGLDRSVGIHR